MANILVVDDENNIRMMVRLTLQHAGHTVTAAADGPEGLDKFGNGKGIDLVLLDQRMPGMEGLDVLREMRARDPRAKIIMATAFGTIDLAVEAMKEGATDFLRKPFTAETLRGSVLATLREGVSGQTSTMTRAGVTFASTTINGFRIEFQTGTEQETTEGFHQVFTVRSPTGDVSESTVILPPYVVELVKAHADRDHLPGGARFWQALCEEALANHLWQNAEMPADGKLRVEEFSAGLKRFVDTVLTS